MFGWVCTDVADGAVAIYPININVSAWRAINIGVTLGWSPGWFSCRRHVTLVTRLSRLPDLLVLVFPPPDNRGEVIRVWRRGIVWGWGWGRKAMRGATCLHCPDTTYSSDLCWGRSISLGLPGSAGQLRARGTVCNVGVRPLLGATQGPQGYGDLKSYCSVEGY